MRAGALKQLREKCLSECGNDPKKAYRMLEKIFKQQLKEKKIVAKDVSIRALFEGLVDMEGIDRNNPVEVAEAVSSSAFTNITTLITHDIVIEPYEVRMEVLDELVTQGDATMTDDENIRGMTAIGGVRRRLETQAYDETDFGEKRVAVRKSDFGRIIALTMEDLFNDRTGDIQDRANTVGEDGTQHRERMIIETLEVLPRTSFEEATSRAFVYDGTAFTQGQFYSADHSAILDRQVNKNVAVGGITEAGLGAAYLNFATMKDERGKEININPTHIIIHKSNELKLATLLSTDRAVGTANNDTNQFGPRGKVKLASVETPYLTSTANLAYMGSPKRSLLWLWVQRPKTITKGADSDLAFRRQIIWQARFNYYGGLAHRDYRYIQRITIS